MSLPAELLKLIGSYSITTSFVVGAQGEVANPDGGSSGIGNSTDKKLLGALRSNAEIVLTSGRTARLERYKMPRTADLAIFTNQGVQELGLSPTPPQRLIVFGQDHASSFSEAIDYLQSIGYQRIHVEFGPTGYASSAASIEKTFLSSKERVGLEKFCKERGLSPDHQFDLGDLIVWAC